MYRLVRRIQVYVNTNSERNGHRLSFSFNFPHSVTLPSTALGSDSAITVLSEEGGELLCLHVIVHVCVRRLSACSVSWATLDRCCSHNRLKAEFTHSPNTNCAQSSDPHSVWDSFTASCQESESVLSTRQGSPRILSTRLWSHPAWLN